MDLEPIIVILSRPLYATDLWRAFLINQIGHQFFEFSFLSFFRLKIVGGLPPNISITIFGDTHKIASGGGRGMFCYHCPPTLHPGAPQPRLPQLEYPFTPTHPCKYKITNHVYRNWSILSRRLTPILATLTIRLSMMTPSSEENNVGIGRPSHYNN
ncbi:Homeodomain [Popillia japonica]|uniref:Homeodomain n=1 Tax=Popillia japonica TaxID=7064 RepID=A0AAW1KKZ4_POPJA